MNTRWGREYFKHKRAGFLRARIASILVSFPTSDHLSASPMFAIRCPYPYCQHENKPGDRFCAACGAPLHLKPCAKCGKVDDVTAKVCSSCNTLFPPIALAEYGAVDAVQAMPAPTKDISAETKAAAPTTQGHVNKTPTHGAMPLIVIALFAGGVPLLWVNRGKMPTPGWQGNGAGNTGVVAPSGPQNTPRPVTPPHINPPPPTIGSPPSIPVPSPTAAVPVPASISAPTPTPAPAEAAAAASRPTDIEPAPSNTRPNGAPAKAGSKTGKANKEVAANKSSRSCTEAVAALGLCDPKQNIK